MEPINVSPTKLVRAWGPSILACGTLLVLLAGPVIELWGRGEPDRALIGGTVVLILCGLMLGLIGYWLAQIVGQRGIGLRSEGEDLIFLSAGSGRFLRVAWSNLASVDIVRSGLSERVALTTRSGRRHTIASNVLTGQTSDIVQRIKSAASLEG